MLAERLGYVEVAGFEEDSPDKLWARYHDVSGLSESHFFDYYSGARRGVAIRVGRTWRLSRPLELAELADDLNAPQSFIYLTKAQFETVATTIYQDYPYGSLLLRTFCV